MITDIPKIRAFLEFCDQAWVPVPQIEGRAVARRVQVRAAIHIMKKAALGMVDDEINFQIEQPIDLSCVKVLTGRLGYRLPR